MRFSPVSAFCGKIVANIAGVGKMKSFFRVVIVVTVGLLALPVLAHGDDVDYKVARELRKEGKIVAVEKLLRDAMRRRVGTLLEIELEVEEGRYLYEIEILDDNGVVFEYYYDAQSGQFLHEGIHDD